MKLLAWVLFIVAWTSSCCALIVPEDCNDARIEKDAGVALNLINKHRKEGYIFALFRVADAHFQHVKNASIAYLTLDVLETQCPDLGQCKAVVYINELSKRKLLYAYNCTVSPVPPKIFECEHCPVLEDTEKHTEEANKILEKYRLGSSESNYFKVEKVQKVFSTVANHTVFIVEFIIKETRCPRNIDATSVSQCEFLPDGKANLGFCIGKIVKETGAPDVVEVDSCVIYDTQTQEERPGIPPPPGPQYPPPPPGGPHHFPPSKYPPPPPGPPPPRPFPRRPDDHHRRPYGRFPNFDHGCYHHHHRCNDTVCKREESGSSEEHDSFSRHLSLHRSSVDFVHHVPILSEHDVLQAPGANFLDHPLPDQERHGKHIIQPFPEVSSGSKSCPGKPKYYL
ncbi:Histidine-rich glycoprotein, partial [Ophiophagus hannah]